MINDRRSCSRCKYFSKEVESWEMPHIYWYECDARPGMANLKSFPFKQTKCASFSRGGRLEPYPYPHANMLGEDDFESRLTKE